MTDRIMDFWKRAPEDQFDMFFEYAPILMHSVNERMEVQKISRFWATKLGYKPDEVIGRKISDFAFDQTAKHIIDRSFEDLQSGKSLYFVEFSFNTSGNQEVVVLMSSSGKYGTDGQLIESLSIVFDHTEAATAKRAVEASDAKSRFLAAMSHEIRTPMNAILGFAQLLRRSKLDKKQSGQIEAIISSGNNLMHLLGDLLDLSRIEAGKMAITSEPFDLINMIDDVMNLWQSIANERNLRLKSTLDYDIPRRISADSGRIRQVLNNFLSNAIKFTDEGSIVLNVEHIKTNSQTTWLRFEVVDTGCGIDQDKIDTLFAPFTQVDATVAKEIGGWGLGLSICNHLTELMDAKIGATSEPGIGSRFYFEVPVEAVSPLGNIRPPVEPAIGNFKAATPLNILVAEDSLTDQELITSILTEIGHTSQVVRNGFEALSALQDQRFDAILMEVSSPGLDGIGATEKIRNVAGAQRDIPIIAVTDNIKAGAREQYLAMGMNDYVSKPVDITELGKAIQRAVNIQAMA